MGLFDHHWPSISQTRKRLKMKYLGAPQSGSQAGTTASHNRAGQYYRNRRSPVQPVGTGRRGVARSAFGAASTAYAAMTASEQSAWAAYASSHPYTDSLGQAIKLTGHQMSVAINAQLLNCGQVLSTVPPVSDAVFFPGLTSFTAVSTGAITLTLAGTGTAADFILEAFSAPQSGGRSYCKTFWQQAVVAGNLATAQIITTGYEAQFGIPPAGSRIFYKLTPVNQYGVAGTPNLGFITVT